MLVIVLGRGWRDTFRQAGAIGWFIESRSHFRACMSRSGRAASQSRHLRTTSVHYEADQRPTNDAGSGARAVDGRAEMDF